MSYQNWSDEAQLVADTAHIRVKVMHEVLTEMSGIKFSLVTQRQSAIDMWNNMRREFPVAHDKQFIPYATFVSFETGDFARLEAQLLQALDLKEFSKHRDQPKSLPEQPSGRVQKFTGDTGHVEGVLLTASPEDDANTAFRNAIRALKVQLGHAGNVVGRATFEARFQLEWKDK